MLLFKLSIIFQFICLIKSWEDSSGLLLDLKDGKIFGRYMESETGKPVKAFLGIPYAEPPVGDLRFKAPQKIKAWDGIKNTQFDGSYCVQNFDPIPRPPGPFGDEDCLFLNVYVPLESTEKMSVMVWIHGGGFAFGDGGMKNNGPEYILENGVILVSGNYRLGPLGFLSTEDKNAQGNQGYKDQQMILQWVQDNIEYFGGDKDGVTIWGESAGAWAVNYHMLFSKGLFQRGISNSGTIHNTLSDPWRKGEALEATKRLAKVLSCDITDSDSILSCLRTKTAFEIISATGQANWANRAVVEDFELSETAFIPKREFIKESVNIPWLVGMNAQEGLIYTQELFSSETSRNQRIATWNEDLPKVLDYDHLESSEKEIITKKITQFYFGTDALTEGFSVPKLTDLLGDGRFIGTIEAIKQRIDQNNNRNIYVYLLTHKGSASVSLTENYEGTCHADDNILLFPQHKFRFMSSMLTDDDEVMIKLMPELWTNFVKYGNPNPSSSNSSQSVPTWPVASTFPFNYMRIGNENGLTEGTKWFSVSDSLLQDRATFWMKLREDHKLSRWNNGNKEKVSLILLFILSLISFAL